MDKNGQSLYDAGICQPRRYRAGDFSRHGNTLYLHTHFLAGRDDR